jgi:hypothetical protein
MGVQGMNIKDCKHEKYEYTDGMIGTSEPPYDSGDFWWTVSCKMCGEEIAEGDFYSIPDWVKDLSNE